MQEKQSQAVLNAGSLFPFFSACYCFFLYSSIRMLMISSHRVPSSSSRLIINGMKCEAEEESKRVQRLWRIASSKHEEIKIVTFSVSVSLWINLNEATQTKQAARAKYMQKTEKLSPEIHFKIITAERKAWAHAAHVYYICASLCSVLGVCVCCAQCNIAALIADAVGLSVEMQLAGTHT